MYDKCKTCLAPVYPYGVSYAGPSCMYHGNHPQYNQPLRTVKEQSQTASIDAWLRIFEATRPHTNGSDNTIEYTNKVYDALLSHVKGNDLLATNQEVKNG